MPYKPKSSGLDCDLSPATGRAWVDELERERDSALAVVDAAEAFVDGCTVYLDLFKAVTAYREEQRYTLAEGSR